MTANEIKELIKSKGLKQWHVAEAYGLSEGNFSRLLRKDPTDETLSRIMDSIKQAENAMEKSTI
ncbi:helix-turn-helix domain-containing protein [Gracilibacillus saliphilus]|uniref:helix-turn-helix domain-containing protein n=1 Tax=Gracilibacillus saliphilus TaxID=543890 RepID=UPI0013D48046|nr:helix-turn-helix domain-containing protein [Gracilibacillus saliphilus]